MSLATTMVNGTGSVSADVMKTGERPVKSEAVTQKSLSSVKKEGDNRKSPLPKLNLKELELALQNAVNNTRFSYKINDSIDMLVVKIIDKSTDEIIREIPGEEIQQLHENLQEAIGLLFDREI